MTNQTKPPFHWSQVESADYRQYLANLRALALETMGEKGPALLDKAMKSPGE